jgi:hypothetical protein
MLPQNEQLKIYSFDSQNTFSTFNPCVHNPSHVYLDVFASFSDSFSISPVESKSLVELIEIFIEKSDTNRIALKL